MKKQLCLLRHAKSSWDDPDLADADRPLAKRGRKACALLRDWFRKEAVRPDLVLVSSAVRARETLQGLEPWPAPPQVEILPALYHAAPAKILDIVRAAPETAGAILVIGHNPGLQDFVLRLSSLRDDPCVRSMAASFPTGALAQFAWDGPWAELEFGRAAPVRFITPRELKPREHAR